MLDKSNSRLTIQGCGHGQKDRNDVVQDLSVLCWLMETDFLLQGYEASAR